MSGADGGAAAAPSTFGTLRRLYLMLFLRGGVGAWRGQQQAHFISHGLVLVVYALLGCVALGLHDQPIFSIAAFLHAMTFIFVAIFVTGSAGEVLFNSREIDTLLFRPIQPRALLAAKIAALAQLAICLAWALNLVGTLLGLQAPDGDWRFLPVHALSTALEALFVCGCIVLVYQLCLKWFGRERLERWVTLVQVGISVLLILFNRLLPRIYLIGNLLPGRNRPWLLALPPAWFAGFDDALAGRASPGSPLLAALACGATGIVLWAALGKLAGDYARGLQRLADVSRPALAVHRARRWTRGLFAVPLIRWWLRRPVERALGLVTLAYLLRDREVMLRVYPALVWALIIPLGAVLQAHTSHGFAIATAGVFAASASTTALKQLRYSQHWQAAELFRVAPLAGPGPLLEGARRAVLMVFELPLFALLALTAWFMGAGAQALLLIPGLVILPVCSLIPLTLDRAAPLSLAPRALAGGAGCATTIGTLTATLVCGLLIAGLATLALRFGCFGYFLLAESLVALAVYYALKRSIAQIPWQPLR